MKKKKFVNGKERSLRFELFHNSLFKQKIIKNKKKQIKKFNWKKESADYLSVIFN